MKKDVISVKDFSKGEIEEIVTRAEEMIPFYQKRTRPPQAPKNVKATFAFFEPSTRTLGSYTEAARVLGLAIKEITGPEATSLMKKESFADTVRMLASQGADILVMRTAWEGTARFAAEILSQTEFNVSIQNAGDGANQHPTQTILDLVTIKQILGRLENFKIGLVGDLKHSRTVHSLLSALRHFPGIKLALFATTETKLQEEYKRGFVSVEEVNSLEELKGCDIVYATRLQRERFKNQEELQKAEGTYLIDKKMLDIWGDHVFVMHPLPCVDEISPEIKSDPRVLMYKQAWYGIPARMALLLEGYKHKTDTFEILRPQKFEIENIGRKSIDEIINEKREKAKHLVPIRRGINIDHLRSGKIDEDTDTVDQVKFLLRKVAGLPHKGVSTSTGVQSSRFGKKDIMIIRDWFIPDEAAFLVTLLSPEATFNFFYEKTEEKKKVKIPEMISGLKCPNENCITNLDPEAQAKFWTKRNGDCFELTCYYCERRFKGEEVVFHNI